MNASPAIPSSGQERRGIIGWSLLIGLLILRIPCLGFITLIHGATPDWLLNLYEPATYFLIACLIWLERDNLADFHIDGLALTIIMVFKPIETLLLRSLDNPYNPFALPNIGSYIFWAIPIGLALALRIRRPQLPKFSMSGVSWFGIGMLVGVIGANILGYPLSFQINPIHPAGGAYVLDYIRPVAAKYGFQLGFAAVSEEPVFRGFLWGFLRKAGWRNVWILIFQMILFVLGHIYFASSRPVLFFVTMPIGAIVLGLLVWRSKTISSSMAAHAAFNEIGTTVGYMISYFGK